MPDQFPFCYNNIIANQKMLSTQSRAAANGPIAEQLQRVRNDTLPWLISFSLGLMRTCLLLTIALSVAACAQGVRLGVESSQDLGHGFHRDIIAQAIPPSAHFFESVGHFEYLFYRARKLCQLSHACAVAPSGNAIVYQDGPSGKIFVFHRSDAKAIQLTRQFPGLVDKFVWREPKGIVDAFVVPPSPSTKPGRWIKLPIEHKT